MGDLVTSVFPGELKRRRLPSGSATACRSPPIRPPAVPAVGNVDGVARRQRARSSCSAARQNPAGAPRRGRTTVPSPGLYMAVQVSPSVLSFNIMPANREISAADNWSCIGYK